MLAIESSAMPASHITTSQAFENQSFTEMIEPKGLTA